MKTDTEYLTEIETIIRTMYAIEREIIEIADLRNIINSVCEVLDERDRETGRVERKAR